jgi:hypothetical protein
MDFSASRQGATQDYKRTEDVLKTPHGPGKAVLNNGTGLVTEPEIASS